jgi:hypothetical protein
MNLNNLKRDNASPWDINRPRRGAMLTTLAMYAGQTFIGTIFLPYMTHATEVPPYEIHSLLYKAMSEASAGHAEQGMDALKDAEAKGAQGCDLLVTRAFVTFMSIDSADWAGCPYSEKDKCLKDRLARIDEDLTDYIDAKCDQLVGYFLRSIARTIHDPKRAEKDLRAAVKIEKRVCAKAMPFLDVSGGQPSLPLYAASRLGVALLNDNPAAAKVCSTVAEQFEKEGEWRLAAEAYETAAYAEGPNEPRWGELRGRVDRLRRKASSQ